MKKIIAISAGHDYTKKSDNIIRKRIRYLNYGLLGLSTILKHQGNLDVIVFQADLYSVEELFNLIESAGINIQNDCECFLLSIPSYYSITWSAQFCKLVKQRYRKKIIVGGRWVIDNQIEWVQNQLKYVDNIIEGFGEQKLARYFHFPDWQKITDGSKKCFDFLDYKLLFDYKKYQPYIEVSRGCGSGCNFCADKATKRLPNKPVAKIMAELDYLDQLYDKYSVYFEAPHFIFNQKWITELCDNLHKRTTPILWRCTSRVETVPTHLLKSMAGAGLKVLDIGLESASCKQLIRMNKTNDPHKYLDQAEKILLECAKHDIWVKFNILLYAGETFETINETIQWLTDRKDIIKDVSVSNLVFYKNMDSISSLLMLGATIPFDEDINKTGYVELNLSDEIDQKTARKFTVEIPKLIASQKDFFDIKSISYFEPNYTYNEYIKDLMYCDHMELPFYIDIDYSRLQIK